MHAALPLLRDYLRRYQRRSLPAAQGERIAERLQALNERTLEAADAAHPLPDPARFAALLRAYARHR